MNKFTISKLTVRQKKLRRRVLDLSFESNLSHLGSCLSAIDLIDVIYNIKSESEKFVLSNGHAGIAMYAVLEKNGYVKDGRRIRKLNIHPDRNLKDHIYVSTGSLGQGLPIALGMAMASENKNVYCMISDGECTEGSIWEALRVAYEKKVYNLKIILNANGWSAYDRVKLGLLKKRIMGFGHKVTTVDGHNSIAIEKSLKKNHSKHNTVLFAYTSVEQLPFLKGQDAHYYVMNKNDYDLGVKSLT